MQYRLNAVHLKKFHWKGFIKRALSSSFKFRKLL